MDIQAEKIELVKMLLDTNDPGVIRSLKEVFRKKGSVDLWDELSVEQQQEIKQASSETRQGEGVEYESFIAKHR